MSAGASRWQVNTQRPIAYEVKSVFNLFEGEAQDLLFPNHPAHRRRFVVLGASVHRLYGEKIQTCFQRLGIEARLFSLPSGEEHKTMQTYLNLAQALDEFPIHRRDEPLIAIGGGVLTDAAAFVASTYRRGIPHIKIPSTLMGYVDAAIGIKNGINFNGHKNRLGTFQPPEKVLLDRSLLQTLPRRHLLNGVAEIIKLAVIKDAALFDLLERDGAGCLDTAFQDERGQALLDRAIGGMLEELEPNLFEDDLARKVDFGHTFSYGLETRHEAHLLHGEAVLLDILLSTQIALGRGLLCAAEARRVFDLVTALGYELNLQTLDADTLWNSLEERTYHRNGMQRTPLPAGLGGCVFANDLQRKEINLALERLLQEMSPLYEQHLYQL